MTAKTLEDEGPLMKTFHSKGASVVLFLLALIPLALACRPPVLRTPSGASKEGQPSAVQLSGAAAQEYLERPGEGQSLMAALTAARFGLKHEEHAPFDEKSGAGYLAMSHDQNLNAWFAEDGVTVRPNVPADRREPGWHLGFRLKAYGYSKRLVDAPPIVSQQVKGTRVEYKRATSFIPHSEIRN
ncbi:MAG: hypothetical protein DLM73_13650 [Chthoniobacterales bacterium]|nr:MAG: hypothetical protein DLM73_13650 [Chthoniobacterales bacterium]